MANDHYIPKVYIKKNCISNSNKLFYYRKNHRNTKVEIGSPAKICYGINTYHISEESAEKNNIDIRYLDQNILKKYEDNMGRNFLPFLQDLDFIPKANAIFVANFLFQIKIRSEFYRKLIFNETNIFNAIENAINNLLQLYPNDIDEIISTRTILMEKYQKEINRGELHSNSMLRTFTQESSIRNTIVTKLLNHKWNVINTPENIEFISSDNPGIVFNKDNTTSNTYFGGDGLFIIQLTPKKALQIDLSSEDIINDDCKKLNILFADNHSVEVMNQCTFRYCDKTIYSSSEVVLKLAMSQSL